MPPASLPPGPLATPEGVGRVIANPDPISRNLQITQSYHELTVALDPYLGGTDVPWCVFATWASKGAGRFIRNEEVPPPLARFLGLDGGRRRPWWRPTTWLHKERFLRYARLTVEEVAAHLAEGNRIVYTKLAPLYATFLELVHASSPPDPAGFEAFLRRMAAEPDTTEALPRAFRHLADALADGEPKPRAERSYLSNLLVGWHEQTRLQEAIDGALSAPIRRALDDPERTWFDFPLPLALRRLGAGLFRRLLAPAIRSFEDDWKQVATQCTMTLALPGERLYLGLDLPPLPDGSMYPGLLAEITLAEALELLARLDRTPDTTAGSAARDWSRLEDRMNYVADFFRSRAEDRSLLQPPFTRQQVAAIHAGEVPPGPL